MVPFQIDRERIQAAVDAGIAITLLHRPVESLVQIGVDFVNPDTEIAAEKAVNHLIDRGHTRIGMIAGIPGTPPREARVRGYREALRRHGLPHDDLLIRGADYQEEGGYEAMRDLLKLEPRPTAVFAANDLMALGAMMALREAGIAIPGEMAIVGLDNIPAARLVHPTLTTIAQTPETLGRDAAELLFSRLAGQAPVTGRIEHKVFDLIVRESS
jgi:LacI family transcriptional regulator